MEKVVDIPTFVGNPHVVRFVALDVVKRQEVGHQYFVHLAVCLKGMQAVLASVRLHLNMCDFAV